LPLSETKRRNPRFGYQWIAEQLALVFDVEIDKDIVRPRAMASHSMYSSDFSGHEGK